MWIDVLMREKSFWHRKERNCYTERCHVSYSVLKNIVVDIADPQCSPALTALAEDTMLE